MEKNNLTKTMILLLSSCLLAGVLFTCLYHYDNKYTVPGEVTQDKHLVLPGTFTEDNLTIHAVNGWELYPDMLLSSQQLATGKYAPVDTFIGQYLSFAALHADGSPYGQATYRLRYEYNGNPAICSILIPEVFSAANVYADGKLIAKSGNISPYSPHTQTLTATFPVHGAGELVIWTANFSHYYSGITYPPILASHQTMARTIGAHTMFYGFLCFTALAVALFSSAIWIGNRRKDSLTLWFGILALSFVVRIAYPFVRLLEIPPSELLYAAEDCAALFGVYCALRITFLLTGTHHTKYAQIIGSLARGMVAVGAFVPLLVLPALPAYTAVYALLISWYKLLTALLLIVLAFMGAIQGVANSLWLLGGVTVYGAGLCAGTLLVNRFEPIIGGWMDEYGSFGMVLCFAVLMVLRSRAIMAENLLLNEHLQAQVEEKTSQVTSLLDERQRFLSEVLHDLKSPMTSVLTYTKSIRQNNILLNEEDNKKLQVIEEKCSSITNKIRTIQDFTSENPLELHMESLDLKVLTENFCLTNRPDIEAAGPELLFRTNLCEGALFIRGDKEKLCRMLQNLVYNSAGFTPPDGRITVTLDAWNNTALLSVKDTGCGIFAEEIPKLFDRFYTTRHEDGGNGLGLYIVKNIVIEHNGTISVESRPGHGSDFTIQLPIIT